MSRFFRESHVTQNRTIMHQDGLGLVVWPPDIGLDYSPSGTVRWRHEWHANEDPVQSLRLSQKKKPFCVMRSKKDSQFPTSQKDKRDTDK